MDARLRLPLTLCIASIALATTACTALLGAEDPMQLASDAGSDATTDASVWSDAGGPWSSDGAGVWLTISPSQWSISVPPGSSALPSMTFDVTNLGASTSPPLSASLLGDAAYFVIAESTCSAPLGPGKVCSVTVVAQPNPGASANALLQVGAGAVDAYAALTNGAGGPVTGSSSSSGGSSSGGMGSSGSGGSSSGTGSSSGAPLPDSGTPPNPGTLLFPGSQLDVWGITAQSLAIVTASSPPAISAVPVGGGSSVGQTLQSAPTSVVVDGNSAFVWEGSSLWIWTPGATIPVLASQSSTQSVAAANGSYAYFFESSSDGSASFDFVQAPLSNPSAKTVIASGVFLSSGGPGDPCMPRFVRRFGTVFAGVCTQPGGPVDLWTLPGMSPTAPARVASGIGSVWGPDVMGARVFVAGPSGAGQVLDATGVLLDTLDSNVTGGMLPGPAVYVAGGSLREAAAASPPMPSTLDIKAAGLWQVSPSGNYALYYAMAPSNAVPQVTTSDIRVVGTTGSSTPQTVSSSAYALPLGFTTDESHVLWLEWGSSPMSPPQAYYASTVNPSKTLLSSAFAQSPLPAHGALVVYTALSGSTASLYALDTSSGGSGQLAPQTRPQFVVTPDLTQVVYSTDTTPSGLYRLPLP